MKLAVGIDIGGTNTKLGLVSENGDIINFTAFPTTGPQSFEAYTEKIKEVVTELIQDNLTTKTLKMALAVILDEYERTKFFMNYYELEKKLGGRGASEKVASLIINSLN